MSTTLADLMKRMDAMDRELYQLKRKADLTEDHAREEREQFVMHIWSRYQEICETIDSGMPIVRISDDAPGAVGLVPDQLFSRNMKIDVEIAVDSLPEPDRSVFIMRKVRQMTVDETRERLNLSKIDANRAWCRAIDELWECLEDYDAKRLNSALEAEELSRVQNRFSRKLMR